MLKSVLSALFENGVAILGAHTVLDDDEKGVENIYTPSGNREISIFRMSTEV